VFTATRKVVKYLGRHKLGSAGVIMGYAVLQLWISMDFNGIAMLIQERWKLHPRVCYAAGGANFSTGLSLLRVTSPIKNQLVGGLEPWNFMTFHPN